MKWLRKIRSFFSMSPVQRRRTLEALVALAATGAFLRLRGYGSTHLWLEASLGKGDRRAGDEKDLETAAYLGIAVEVAAGNLPYEARCLERSLALWWMLARRDLDARLRIGVRKAETGLEAHAWIEFQGHQINDGSDVVERYAPFEATISPGSADML